METLIEDVNSNILSLSQKEKRHKRSKETETNSARSEKQKKAAEKLKEKETQREVLKKKKERLIAVLDSELSDPQRSPRKIHASLSSPRSPRKLQTTVATAPHSPLRRSPRPTTIATSPHSPLRRSPRPTIITTIATAPHSPLPRSPRPTTIATAPHSPLRSPRPTTIATAPHSPLRRSPRPTNVATVSQSQSPLRRSPRKILASLKPVSPSLFDDSNQFMSPSPQSSPASTESHSLLFDNVRTTANRMSTLPRSLSFSEDPAFNAKGHPTVAAKQPRNRCETCEILRQENRALKKQIEELLLKASMVSEEKTASHHYARPPPGVYDAEFASRNGMEELFPATGVYVHKDQQYTSLNKANSGTASPQGGRDGKRMARYLLTVFFTKEQLQQSSLTKSEASKYDPLNQQIVEAIIAFSVYNSDTRRGDILKAMRSSLTSKRCKAKKKNIITV